MALRKDHISNAISKQVSMPKIAAVDLVEKLLEIIKSSLETGEDVLISGFGKFCVKKKQERRGRNPATGDSIMLKPRRVVTFSCSRILREKINGR